MRLGQIGFSCRDLIFAIFIKYPVPSINNISFLLSTCNRNFKQYDGVRQYFIVYRFVSERKRLSEQTRFLGTVFLCGEFKLENIFSGVNFPGNFYLRELVFADPWKNRKIRTRKNPVPHGTPGG